MTTVLLLIGVFFAACFVGGLVAAAICFYRDDD